MYLLSKKVISIAMLVLGGGNTEREPAVWLFKKSLPRVIRLTQSLDIGQDFQKLSFQIIHGVTTVCHLFSSKHAWDKLKKTYAPNGDFSQIFLDDQSHGRKYNNYHLPQIQVGRLAPQKPCRVLNQVIARNFQIRTRMKVRWFRPYFFANIFLASAYRCYTLSIKKCSA